MSCAGRPPELAIELAAAQASALGLGVLADRLGTRLDLLSGGRRTDVPRHQSLRAIVDWSHALLTNEEAELFRRLVVFPGSFRLDQVEAVCSGDGLQQPDIPRLLSRLIEQSLLQAAPDRFWMLETLRAYASERIGGDQEDRLRTAHARDTAQRLRTAAATLWSPQEPEAVAAITSMLPDLHRAWWHAVDHEVDLAVEMAADVFGLAYVRQRLDLLRWSTTLAARGVDHPRMPEVLAAAAASEWAARRMDQAQDHATRAIELAGGPGAPAAASGLDVSADLAMFVGRTDEAIEQYRQVADVHRRADAPLGVLLAEIAAAQAQCYGAGWREVSPRLDDLVTRAHRFGNPTTLAFAYFVAGEAMARVDMAAAVSAYDTAISHGARADSRLFVLLARTSRAAVLASRGTPAAALDAFRGILESWEEIDNEASQWSALQSVVELLARLGSPEAGVIAGAVQAQRVAGWVRASGCPRSMTWSSGSARDRAPRQPTRRWGWGRSSR